MSNGSNRKGIIIFALFIMVMWVAITIVAKPNVREVQMDLTWETVSPSHPNYEQWVVELDEVGQYIPVYSDIQPIINRLISPNNIVKVVIYSPSENINPDTVVLVFLANQNPKEVTEYLTIAQIEEWQYSAFMVKDIQNDKYGVVIISKDSDNIAEIEKVILRVE